MRERLAVSRPLNALIKASSVGSPGRVPDRAALIRSEAEIAGDERGALLDLDHLWGTDISADALQDWDHVGRIAAEPGGVRGRRIGRRRLNVLV